MRSQIYVTYLHSADNCPIILLWERRLWTKFSIDANCVIFKLISFCSQGRILWLSDNQNGRGTTDFQNSLPLGQPDILARSKTLMKMCQICLDSHHLDISFIDFHRTLILIILYPLHFFNNLG